MSHIPTPVTLEVLLVHRQWVRSLARRLVADENDADDVEQQVWLEATRHPPGHLESPRGWLGTVVRNVARKFGRGRTRRTVREQAWNPVSTAPSPDGIVAEAELQQSIGRAVLDLAEPYRTTVLLRYFEGLSPADVALRMGTPVETVRTRLRRANDRLREILDAEFGGDRDAWFTAILAWPSVPSDVPPAVTTTAALTAGGMAMAGSKTMVTGAVLLSLALGGLWAWIGSGAPDLHARIHGSAHETPGAAAGNRIGRGDGVTAASPGQVTSSELPLIAGIPGLDLERDLHGIVVSRDGSPIGGARVEALAYPWRTLGATDGGLSRLAVRGPEGVSRADGTFSLRLRNADAVSVRVSAPGFATAEWSMLNAGERVRFVLAGGAGLRVVVTDWVRAPVAGARVIVRPLDRAVFATSVREGATGADGILTLDALPADQTVEIAVWGPCTGSPVVHRTLLPELGEAVEEVMLGSGHGLAGRVTDARTGAPIAGALVGGPVPGEGAVATGEDGEFILGHWEGSGLTVSADGYATELAPVGDRTRVEVSLEPGASITARILDTNGAPVPGALPAASGSAAVDGKVATTEGHATSDGEGRVRIDGLRGDVDILLRVAADGHGRLSLPVAAHGTASTFDLGDVTLQNPQAISGTVIGSDDRPVPGAPVTVGPADRMPWLPGESHERRANHLGRFTFPDLAPGTYIVRSGPRQTSEAAVRVTLSQGGDLTDVVLRLQEESVVRVRVVDESGDPIAGMEVAAGASQGRMLRDRTDRKGTVSFHLARVGAWVVARPDGMQQPYATAGPRSVGAWEEEVTLVLETAVRVMGRIVGPQGEPIAGALVTTLREGAATGRIRSDGDGGLTIAVPNGRALDLMFDGRVSEDGREFDMPLRGALKMVGEGSQGFVLQCEPIEENRSLLLRAVTPSGEPLAGAVLKVMADGQLPIATLTTGPDGRARQDGLQFRPLLIFGQHDGLWIAPARLRVPPTGTEVVVQFREPATVSGVVEYQGSPIAFVRIFVREGGWPVGETVTDSTGAFSARVPCHPERDLSLIVSGRPLEGTHSGTQYEGRVEGVEPWAVGVVVPVTGR